MLKRFPPSDLLATFPCSHVQVEDTPGPRQGCDSILLPNGLVLIVNGGMVSLPTKLGYRRQCVPMDATAQAAILICSIAWISALELCAKYDKQTTSSSNHPGWEGWVKLPLGAEGGALLEAS